MTQSHTDRNMPRRPKLLSGHSWTCFVFVLASALVASLNADEVDDAVAVLSHAGPQATGSREAKLAAEKLARLGPEIVPRLLVAMDTPNIVAANWCRVGFDRIVDRELPQSAAKFPRETIERFIRDASRQGRARRLGLTLMDRLDPAFRWQAMSGWLDDVEFRPDAVSFALQQGDEAKGKGLKDVATHQFQIAFRHARESQQVLQAMTRLMEVGVKVDPVQHLGFIDRWYLVGPFDAPLMTGFSREFPPEQRVELSSEYDDGAGRKLRWRVHATHDTLAQVNLIQAIGPVKEAVGYAYVEIDSPRMQSVQLRCSADDNLTVWLNGSKVLAREQWLNGTRLDRFITPVTLEPGRNRLLVKICQGTQHVNPEVPNNWSFQLRLCDETGGAIGVRTILPPAP